MSCIPAFDHNGTIGAFFIGTVFSLLLLGVNWSQTLSYYRRFKDDKVVYKYLVGFACSVDTFHTLCCVLLAYSRLITNYGKVELLLLSPWSFSIDPFLTGLMASLVEIFFAFRIYTVSKGSHGNIAVPVFVVTASLTQFAFAAASSVEAFQLVVFSLFPTNPNAWFVYVWLGVAAVTDIIITSVLIYYLRVNKRGSSPAATTNSIIDKIIKITVSNNLASAVCSLIHAILFATLLTSYHIIFNFLLIKLYYSSLITSLNSRAGLRKMNCQLPLTRSYPLGDLSSSQDSAFEKDQYPSKLISVLTTRSVTTDQINRRDYEEFYAKDEKSRKPFHFHQPHASLADSLTTSPRSNLSHLRDPPSSPFPFQSSNPLHIRSDQNAM